MIGFLAVMILYSAAAQPKPPLKLINPPTTSGPTGDPIGDLWREVERFNAAGDRGGSYWAACKCWKEITACEPGFPASIHEFDRLPDGRTRFIAAGFCFDRSPVAVGDTEFAMVEIRNAKRTRTTYRGQETYDHPYSIVVLTHPTATLRVDDRQALASGAGKFGVAWIGIGSAVNPASLESLDVVALYVFQPVLNPCRIIEAQMRADETKLKSEQKKSAESARRLRQKTAVTASIAPGLGPNGKPAPGWYKVTASNSDRERTDPFTVEILAGANVIHRHPFKPLAPGGSKYVTIDLRGKPTPTGCRVVLPTKSPAN